MRSMKRVQLAVLFLIAAALLAGTPALAAPPRSTNLTCVVTDPTDPDYGASGVAKLSVRSTYWDNWYGVWKDGNLTVSCRGLTPGVTYTVYGYYVYYGPTAFTPTGGGNGGVGGFVGFWNSMELYVVREDGTPVLKGIVY